MRSPEPLTIHSFGSTDPLSKLADDPSQNYPQAGYLRSYLGDLGVKSVLEEPYYFDRDYLSEFASFYGTSAHGYQNVCRRLTFFTVDLTRDMLTAALRDEAGARVLQDAFKGFVVLRPIDQTPLGRTVVDWYPDSKSPRRVIGPARCYTIHVAGLPLQVKGLAWQEQDSAVGACATVALWSVLHSSAFDEQHAIPTTAEITRSAHRTASLGARVFPSQGLNAFQIREAIKEHGLAPDVLEGDRRARVGTTEFVGFSRGRFGASLGLFLRSGYAVLMMGRRFRGGQPEPGHAIVAVGLRPGTITAPPVGSVALEDEGIEHVYVHDDNIGPGAKLKVVDWNGLVSLERDPPAPRSATTYPDPTSATEPFLPQTMIAAVQDELRVYADSVHRLGLTIAFEVAQMLVAGTEGITFGVRFMTVWAYLGEELTRQLQDADVRARVRLELTESVAPMSLHIGIVRLGMGTEVLADLLIDTTEHHPRIFCYVAFDQDAETSLEALRRLGLDVGVRVLAT